MLVFLTLFAAVQQPDTITLERALARAREARAAVAAAQAGVDEAAGLLRVAGRIPNPTLQLETDELAPTRKLTTTQPLDWLLRRWPERAAGRSVVVRAEAERDQALAELAREVRFAFFAALAAEEHLRLVAEVATYADSVRVLASRRADAGDISLLEYDQVVQEAGRARLTLSQTREAARVARFELGRAVGASAAEAPVPVGSLDDGLDAPAQNGNGQPTDAVPTLRAALADSAAASARLRAAQWARLPLPALVAGREWGETDARGVSVILGFSVAVPLWSQGGEVVAIARAQADRSAALATEARSAVATRLAQAELRLSESADRARFARDTLFPSARRLRAGAIRLFEEGQTGILAVFDALRSERDIAQELVRELLAFQNARAERNAALGLWR